jgi:cytochrome c-type biogenesis protein CcsB
MVDRALALYSDYAYHSALVVYLLAMTGHTVELGFGSRARRRERVLVASGAGGSSSGEIDDPPATEDRTRPTRAERFGRIGVALTVLAALVHLISLALRGLATSRVPWGNMYEYISAVCLAAVIAWLVVLRRDVSADRDPDSGAPLRQLAVYVLLPVTILLFLAGTYLYAEASPLLPALRSYWIAVHVSAAVIASGVFLVSGVASVLYLRRAAAEAKGVDMSSSRIPSMAALDRLAYRTTVFAFPLLTFGIICGAIWAEAAWGRYWGWDPKETCAFVAWVVYAAYLHARATAGWRGRSAAYVNIVGFAVTVFNLFFVNLVTSGLHSYAGV